MVTKTFGAAIYGVEAQLITIEVNIVQGTSLYIVGLPDNSIKESQHRIESALKSMNFRMPRQKVIVNLAPADIHKEGSAYDLPGRVIPNFVRRAITGETMTIEGGSQMIDFTYIKDTVWAFCQCIELIPAGPVNKETITISPGEGHTLQEIVEILSSELGRNLNVRITPERNYDVQRFVGNRARREKLLGDRRFLSLPEGIRQTLTLYKNLYRNDELKG